MFFGLGGCGFTYIIAPILDNLYHKINPKLKNVLCIILLLSYGTDLVYTKIHPNTGKGISEPVVEENTNY